MTQDWGAMQKIPAWLFFFFFNFELKMTFKNYAKLKTGMLGK